jgi:hypothetical protein
MPSVRLQSVSYASVVVVPNAHIWMGLCAVPAKQATGLSGRVKSHGVHGGCV